MDKQIKTIFMGTPELAKSGLQALLLDDSFLIQAVISQADKSSGRNLNIQKTPVKIIALENNLLIYQPGKIKEIIKEISDLQPDLIVVIAYGKILPKEILDIPTYGCINVHASLLPKYRGSSCIANPILEGDKVSGITIMKMDENMDTGDIIKQIEISLDEDETSKTLLDKIIRVTHDNLAKILKDYVNNNLKPFSQDNSKATYVKMIKKEDGHLNFNETAEIIERKIRAYFPWPGTYSFLKKDDLSNNKLLFKILKSEKTLIPSDAPIGQLFLDNNRLVVKCSDYGLVLSEVQLEGKKPMTTNEFLKGNAWIIGKILN
ncbi:MAG TPA: methionyl-tRNA formyltransferase [bacterium]|nr:methionyl-tRNA formyltransferase [bacterium]